MTLVYEWEVGHIYANILFRGINEGRQAAREVDLYLEHSTGLPVTGGIVKRSAEEVFAAAKAATEMVPVAA